MGVLHLIFHSSAQTSGFQQCLERTGNKDSVLLLGGAVVGAKEAGVSAQLIKNCAATIYVLQEDLAARGISPEEVVNGVTLITFDGFVDLTVTHSQILSW